MPRPDKNRVTEVGFFNFGDMASSSLLLQNYKVLVHRNKRSEPEWPILLTSNRKAGQPCYLFRTEETFVTIELQGKHKPVKAKDLLEEVVNQIFEKAYIQAYRNMKCDSKGSYNFGVEKTGKMFLLSDNFKRPSCISIV